MREPNSRANRADVPVDVSDEKAGQRRGTGRVDKREREAKRKSEIKRIAKESRGETGGREARGERAKWLSTAATRQRSPSSTMMDAFMNDPTEPRTSLLLPPSSFSYFIFTFLDRRKSANLWVIRPLCRVEAHTESAEGSGLIERYGEPPPAAYAARRGRTFSFRTSLDIADSAARLGSFLTTAEKTDGMTFPDEFPYVATRARLFSRPSKEISEVREEGSRGTSKFPRVIKI